MKIVTSGFPYIDIDAYACCIAYTELLNLRGEAAQAVSTSLLNESITPTVRGWKAPLATTYKPSEQDTYVLVDVSDPDHFDTFVGVERVAEVIDHHPGLETFWLERIGRKAQIDFIGAACTQVYENWKAAGALDKMSLTSARLLVCGILDNTLNFGAKVSTPRDKAAYEALLSRAKLPADWTATYFSECQASILANPKTAIKNDTKLLRFASFDPDAALAAGQLVAWDGRQVLGQYLDILKHAMDSTAPKSKWFINMVSIEEGRSYFVSDNGAVRAWLTRLLGVTFEGAVATSNRLWLRKEIVKEDTKRRG